MGVPKKNYIRLEFDREFGLPEEFNTADSTMEALKEFYKEQNPDGHPDPHFNIYDHEAFDFEAQFEVYSDRAQNCDFQVDTLREYLEAKYSEELVAMDEDAWTSCS